MLNKLSLAAPNELSSLVTILLGITIASTMTAERFVRLDTLIIIGLGLFAFVFDTFGGVIFAKFLNLFRKEGNKINPMVGACGISAFPMSARVIHQMGQKETVQLPADARDKYQRGGTNRLGSSRGYYSHARSPACLRVT